MISFHDFRVSPHDSKESLNDSMGRFTFYNKVEPL
jgi:hypothetical protein